MPPFSPPPDAVAVLRAAGDQEVTAALEVMYLVAQADGFVAADELRHFLAVARTISDGTLDATRLSELITTWKATQADVPQRSRELALLLGTREARRAAYDLAQAMATADRQLGEAELTVMDQIGEALDLT